MVYNGVMTQDHQDKYPYARYKARHQERRWRKKNTLIERLGGKCVRCGFDDHPAALEFHHKDPATKEFTISPNMTRSIELLEREADKCILLCSNCHQIEHSSYCPDRASQDKGRKPYEFRKHEHAYKVLHVYGRFQDYKDAGGRGQTYTKKKRGLYWVAHCPDLTYAHLLAGIAFSEIYFHDVEREIERYLLSLKRTPLPLASTNKKAAKPAPDDLS